LFLFQKAERKKSVGTIGVVKKKMILLNKYYKFTSSMAETVDRSVLLILSYLGGMFGLDRFYLGQVGWGLLKLITFGFGGLWALVDFVIIAVESLQRRTITALDRTVRISAGSVDMGRRVAVALIFVTLLGAIVSAIFRLV
jgi:TM2 domain-containing membrane protein YozV